MNENINEQTQQTTQIQTHSHKGMYMTIATSLGAVVILFVTVLAVTTKHETSTEAREQAMQHQPTQVPPAQGKQTAQSHIQEVTPANITSKEKLDKVMQILDNEDMSQISSGLNQNRQDASSFSQ